jgi:hypothetical protein
VAARQTLTAIDAEPRTGRAPLGNKTTNAKARTGQPAGVKQIVREFEKTLGQPTTSRKATIRSPQAVSSKLEIHNDRGRSSEEDDVEYLPPPPKDEPFHSDAFPEGVLKFDAFKPENRLKGYYQYYYNPVDGNGVSLRDKKVAEEQQKAFDQLDVQVAKDLMASFENIPGSKAYTKKQEALKTETATRGPSHFGMKPAPTLTSRKAASALSIAPKPHSVLQPKPAKPVNAKVKPMLPFGKKPTSQPLLEENTTCAVASRTTIGYRKGRTASSMVQKDRSGHERQRAAFTRTASTASSGSDVTITPSRYAQKEALKSADEDEDWRRLEFLSIFDVDEGDDMMKGIQDPLHDGVEEEDFQLELKT